MEDLQILSPTTNICRIDNESQPDNVDVVDHVENKIIIDTSNDQQLNHNFEGSAKPTTLTQAVVITKSDLRNTKTELFNKLIASHSQQLIVTRPPSIKDKSEYLYRTNSLNAGNKVNVSSHRQQSASFDQQLQTANNGGKLVPTNSNKSNSILEDSEKRGQVVFSNTRNRWYTNEEVAAILTNFSSHPEWQTNELQVRPKSGAVLMYSREKVRYRQDGYCWKKRKNGRTTREDHMKLKVQGIECIYGCYVHSAILPTFHRRCYWLLQNPDIVLVHYLNQPPDDQNKMMLTFNSKLLEADTKRSWTNEEIIEEIGSVFGGISQIQHMLNLNLPPAATVIQAASNQSSQSQSNEKTNAESSSISQIGGTNEQTNEGNESHETCIVRSSSSRQIYESSSSTGPKQQQNKIENFSDDEMMTTSSGQDEDGNNNLENADNTKNNSSCDMLPNGQKNQTNETTSMTFDIVDECDENDNGNANINTPINGRQPKSSSRFSYANVNGSNIIDEINNNSISGQNSARLAESNQLEQNPCSPVTQIYNKIVDDIETYALPLEPSQFTSDHLHQHNLTMSSMPEQSAMDIVNETDCQQQISHQQQHCNQQEQLRQQHQHQLFDSNQHENLQHYSNCDNDLNNNGCCCDLFAERLDSSKSRVDSIDGPGKLNDALHNESVDDNLLLNDFNDGAVDPLANVDDLLMLTHSGDVDETNLLTDTNPFNLLNFRSIDCGQAAQQLDVKSTTSDTDAISRLSPMGPVPRCNSTGNAIQSFSFNPGDNHRHHSHHNQQHVSNYFLANIKNCDISDNILQDQFHSDSHDRSNDVGSNINHHRNSSTGHTLSHQSSSTNPSSSTSCSASPSSTSLHQRNDLICNITSGSVAQYNSANIDLSCQPYMKLPLQQRQKSEQQESSNAVLSSLLPKALSLDGSDISITNNHFQRHHRLSNSPIGRFDYTNYGGQDLLVIPTTVDQNQSKSMNQAFSRNPQHSEASQTVMHGTIAGSIIPISGNNDILIDSLNTQESSINERQQQQLANNINLTSSLKSQQLPSLTNSVECNASVSTINSLLPILDYVPNWCNITGGAKVLIVGDWSSLLMNKSNQVSNNNGELIKDDGCFTAMFDNQLVSATLIQTNVLRCYAPSHEQGFITLKILYMNSTISEHVLFEMRPSCNQASNIDLSSLNNNDQNDGNQKPSKDHEGNNNDTQHRSSTSSNQSNNGLTLTTSQKSQISPTGNSMTTASSSDPKKSNEADTKVLTLAENIISAMHKKNNLIVGHAFNSRLVNSLDIELLNGYRDPSINSRRPSSLKGTQRRLVSSRSLSRESESITSMNNNYTASFGLMETDPYWHKSTTEVVQTNRLLSVLTDFQTDSKTSYMFGGNDQNLQSMSNSSNRIGFVQSSTNSKIQRPLAFTQPVNSSSHIVSSSIQDNHNLTETTSSSGLGSIVSSLSPSPTSLLSPTPIVCDIARLIDNQSPCSCERQLSGTPSSADFCEYFQASAKTQESFASLTLNDREQQELYEAAKVIQKAFRIYRGRKRQASELMITEEGGNSQGAKEEIYHSSRQQETNDSIVGFMMPQHLQQSRLVNDYHQAKTYSQQSAPLIKCYHDKEMQAATIIQAYYRRYRQYVHFKKQQANIASKASTSADRHGVITNFPQPPLSSLYDDDQSSGPVYTRLVVDTLPIKIDKAVISHVDRKRFKTAILISK